MPQALTYANIVERLLGVAPDFQTQFDRHIEDNGELLPHVLFGDLTRYLIATHQTAKQGDKASAATFERLLTVLEEALARSDDERLHGLICVSFLENLWQADQDYDEIKAVLGPALRQALAKIEDS